MLISEEVLARAVRTFHETSKFGSEGTELSSENRRVRLPISAQQQQHNLQHATIDKSFLSNNSGQNVNNKRVREPAMQLQQHSNPALLNQFVELISSGAVSIGQKRLRKHAFSQPSTFQMSSKNSFDSTGILASLSSGNNSQINSGVGKCPPRDMKRLKKGEVYTVTRVAKWGEMMAVFLQGTDSADVGFFKPPKAYHSVQFKVGDWITLETIGYSPTRNRVAQKIKIERVLDKNDDVDEVSARVNLFEQQQQLLPSPAITASSQNSVSLMLAALDGSKNGRNIGNTGNFALQSTNIANKTSDLLLAASQLQEQQRQEQQLKQLLLLQQQNTQQNQLSWNQTSNNNFVHAQPQAKGNIPFHNNSSVLMTSLNNTRTMTNTFQNHFRTFSNLQD